MVDFKVAIMVALLVSFHSLNIDKTKHTHVQTPRTQITRGRQRERDHDERMRTYLF